MFSLSSSFQVGETAVFHGLKSVVGDVEMHVKDVEVLADAGFSGCMCMNEENEWREKAQKTGKPLNDREAEACDTGRRTTGMGN